MPILGKSGESISQRLFGRPGTQQAGQFVKDLVTPGKTHAAAVQFAERVKKGAETRGGFYNQEKKQNEEIDPNSYTPVSFSDLSKQYSDELKKDAPNDINNAPKGGSGSSNANAIKAIGRGWDDSDDVVKDTSKSLNTSKTYISNLGKVKDEYLKSIDNYKAKNDKAIEGNKTLIEQNQKKDLDILAGDTRKSIENTNIMLGVMGASGGSASKLASKAIAEKAGKERSKVLTARGDQMSAQNQAAANILEDYELRRKQAYEWEENERKKALEDFKEQADALERLKKNKSKWREEDIKAESDRNLTKFFNALNDIQVRARNYRDTLAAKITEYGGVADALEAEAVGIEPPAELDTPKFSETIDLNTEENAEDWFDPTNVGKRRIKGFNVDGSPIYEDDEPVIA